MILSMTPLLNKHSDTPIYDQLYRYIRENIENGKLPSGGKLPAIRPLAQHLNVSKNTVEAAYGQLLAEGYVESRERGGYVIQPIEQLWNLTGRDIPESMRHSFSSIQPSSEADRLEHHIPLPYEFRYGDIAFDRFPQEVWKSCLTQAISDAVETAPYGILGYGDRLGHIGLREELAHYVYQARGAAVDANQIFVCAGTQYAVSLLVQLLRLREGVFAMEEPGYHGVKTVLRGMDCRVAPIPVESDGIDVSALGRTDASIVYVTPSHQFPLGMVMSVEKRLRLLKWASANDALILEDDYDSEFRYGSRPVPSLKALDTDDRVIYMGTLSKAFLPGARLSYVIMPRRLVPLMKERLANYSGSVSPMIQQAVWLFMKQGHYGRHIRRMRRIYQARYRALTESIAEIMGNRAEIVGDKSGMHILLRVAGRESSELIRLAESAGCMIFSAAKHWDESNTDALEFVILGFGGMDEAALREGVRRLGEAWFPA
ncbi:PLP-dependent aminotransferase family protein [Paenibacillus sp. LHD-117]|uniref:MocR-like pyridoxine biosynthesis transcription factor PdxR n=1 Tax=Paenibacillus sp. LHD-117 TaxID=3071412 RepID=UPI0027E12DE1|nr:PLP-dependent aminotransferase family protein [Paenibacillus sp. LHD-117]MDQ6419005.1 PLP-dependent aminotransferase family protein [Paenibacillus sp. LHD-117]